MTVEYKDGMYQATIGGVYVSRHIAGYNRTQIINRAIQLSMEPEDFEPQKRWFENDDLPAPELEYGTE